MFQTDGFLTFMLTYYYCWFIICWWSLQYRCWKGCIQRLRKIKGMFSNLEATTTIIILWSSHFTWLKRETRLVSEWVGVLMVEPLVVPWTVCVCIFQDWRLSILFYSPHVTNYFCLGLILFVVWLASPYTEFTVFFRPVHDLVS